MILFLTVATVVLIIAVFITRVHNDFWLFKVLEYPRLQKVALVVPVLAGWLFYWPQLGPGHKGLFWALCGAAVYLAVKIWPYTIMARKEMKSVELGNSRNALKLFAANVYQPNRNYAAMLQQIRDTDPDVVFLLETDAAWEKGVKELEDHYPYQLKAPLDNTYGLLFYSRLKMEEGKVAYLVKNDIPSIEAVLHLPSGQRVRVWGLHPEPPVPGENLYATAKDKELMLVALQVKDCPLPSIVIGDLNDVAWSHTTELFRKTSHLLDPRRGRGFYSTFSAHHWFVRFPLDYVFCSKEFGLAEMKRLPPNGSDHFATFTHIVYQPSLQSRQPVPQADKAETAEAAEMASQPLKEGS